MTEDRLGEFFQRIRERNEYGEVAYGDHSFHKPTDRLITEIMEELEDVAGWAFIGWERLRRLREKVQREGLQ